MTRRIFSTLNAYAQLLDTRFAFSESNKLPGSKGKLREDAVAEFLKAFVPINHNVATNVFTTTANGDEYQNEIDLVVHNSDLGGLWKLDTFGENSICNVEGITAAIEIKSILNKKELLDAENKAKNFKDFCEGNNIAPPPFLLFFYDIAPPTKKATWLGADEIHDKALSSYLPFDMVICPKLLCYISEKHDLFSYGFEQGLSAASASGDGSVITSIISERGADSRYAGRFKEMGSSPGERLLAFAAFISNCSGNSKHTEALISSAVRPRRNPIFPEVTE